MVLPHHGHGLSTVFLWLLGLVFCHPNPVPQHLPEAKADTASSLTWRTGPSFDTTIERNITAIEGRDVQLPCKVYNLSNRTVSWIRCESLNIISAGHYIYTSDIRFMASVLEDEQRQRQELMGLTDSADHKAVVGGGPGPSSASGSPSSSSSDASTWLLKIRGVSLQDEGCYECQISSQPVRSQYFHLRVVVPVAEILGKPEMFVDVGSTINITCKVRHAPGPLQWMHKDKPIDYTSTRGGVSVITNKAAETTSSLIIQQARTEDGGKYSCHAGDHLVKPAVIKVHVIHGDKSQSLHTNSASHLIVPLTSLGIATFLIVFFGTLRCTAPGKDF